MKNLEALLKGVEILKFHGLLDQQVRSISSEEKEIGFGDVYIALVGYGKDGHKHIPSAIAKGARVIVCSILPPDLVEPVSYLLVEDTYKAVAVMAANYYDHPSRQMKVIGVTGTNGKTSTVTLLHQLFRKLGYRCGLISSICNRINDLEIETDKTTPVSLVLNRLLREMVDAGCKYCFMECSSHGIFQSRVITVKFAGALFTNITHEHIDYHGSFEEYLRVKKSFLDSIPESSFLIFNQDDPNGFKITAEAKTNLKTMSLNDPQADFYCKLVKDDLSGMAINIEGRDISLQLRAAFNGYNVLGVLAVAVCLGEKKEKLLELLPELSPVMGRFDLILSSDHILGIVDYAHTPDAFSKLYVTLNRLKKNKIISVIGFNGERDRTKRPIIAEIAHKNSDELIITLDNPCWEDPRDIVADALSGLEPDPKNLYLIDDREKAIEFARSLAISQDIILVAGKGPDNYQEIQGVRYPFDDKGVLSRLLDQ